MSQIVHIQTQSLKNHLYFMFRFFAFVVLFVCIVGGLEEGYQYRCLILMCHSHPVSASAINRGPYQGSLPKSVWPRSEDIDPRAFDLGLAETPLCNNGSKWSDVNRRRVTLTCLEHGIPKFLLFKTWCMVVVW